MCTPTRYHCCSSCFSFLLKILGKFLKEVAQEQLAFNWQTLTDMQQTIWRHESFHTFFFFLNSPVLLPFMNFMLLIKGNFMYFLITFFLVFTMKI